MEFEIRHYDLDDFFKDLYKEIEKYFEDEDNKTTTSHEKKTKYCYEKPKSCECNTDSSTIKNLNEKIIKLQDDLNDKTRYIETLKDLNHKLTEQGKKVSEGGHELVDKNMFFDKMLNDKIVSDGYKILNDIQVYIEFVRKCDKLQYTGFTDMISRIENTVGGFIKSRDWNVK